MLRKSFNAIDRVAEEIIDHPIRNAKILAGAAAACLAMEKLQHGYYSWRDRRSADYPEEIDVPSQPVRAEANYER